MLQISDVRELQEGYWATKLTPSEVQFLDRTGVDTEPLSILLLTESPTFDRERGTLSFRASAAHLSKAGTSDAAILVYTPASAGTPAVTASESSAATGGTGDETFLRSLPPDLKDLGTALLREVRALFPGDLKFYPKSGKYIQAPDNFWTVRPQKRDRSFRITVRGAPETFTAVQSLELKDDMKGYSSLKVERASQIDDLVRILEQVRRK